MICKFCNAEIGDEHKFCPECGKRQDMEEEVIAENPVRAKKKSDVWKLVLVIVGFVAAICVLAVVLLKSFDMELFPEQDIHYKETYVAEDDKVLDKADTVVATFGKVKLDNALLQVFCVEEFDTFFAQYYDYISYIGLDLSKPLSQQKSYFDEAMTWEQFMIQAAMESWHSYVQMGMLADQEGFVLDGDWKTTLEEMPHTMEAQAKENNYESADALLKERYGEACTLDVYMEYANLVFKANAFYSSKLEVAEDALDAAFAQYEAEFAEKGITKTSALVSSVRHILIEPEGGTTSEDGKTTTYSDAEWAACLEKAEQVLEEWKAGNADEESFKELVTKYTADTASVSTGGLYEGVMNDGTYMKPFQDWAIDFNRQEGDVDLVKTDHGYHIMYFVEGEAEWIYHTTEKVRETRYNELKGRMEKLDEENPVKIKYSKITLQEIYEYEQ